MNWFLAGVAETKDGRSELEGGGGGGRRGGREECVWGRGEKEKERRSLNNK